MYTADAQSKGIAISVVVGQGYKQIGVEFLKGDPARIMQIVTNLVTNSIKFTTEVENKNIEVKIDAALERPISYGKVVFPKDGHDTDGFNNVIKWGDGERVFLIISVTDTGIGMSEAVQNTLFSRFQQAPKTESKYGGSGKLRFGNLHMCA